MQSIKSVILSFIVFFSVTDKCLAEPEEICYPAENLTSAYSEGYCGYNLLNSFICILLSNTGDLANCDLHNSYDKKSYLILFNYFKYHKVYPPAWNGEGAEFYIPAFSGPEKNQYYLYTLRKIIL